MNKESLSHAKWYCKYHVVWIPKYWKKKLFAWLRLHLGEVLHEVAHQKGCRIEEGYLHEDHVHTPGSGMHVRGTAVEPGVIGAMEAEGGRLMVTISFMQGIKSRPGAHEAAFVVVYPVKADSTA